MDFSIDIKGHTLEFVDDIHCYLVDGVIVPSITKILNHKFKHKYDKIDKKILSIAADRGVLIHSAVEYYAKTGECPCLREAQNFVFLQKHYNFDIVDSERPMILFLDNKPVAAGRCDLVLKESGQYVGADIKTTSVLDKEYLAHQLNLYRIAYRQSYDIEWEKLKGIHLKEDVRKYVDIPVNEEIATDLLKDFMEAYK